MTATEPKIKHIIITFIGNNVLKSEVQRLIGAQGRQWYNFLESFCLDEMRRKNYEDFKNDQKVSAKLAEEMVRFCYENEIGLPVDIDFQPLVK